MVVVLAFFRVVKNCSFVAAGATLLANDLLSIEQQRTLTAYLYGDWAAMQNTLLAKIDPKPELFAGLKHVAEMQAKAGPMQQMSALAKDGAKLLKYTGRQAVWFNMDAFMRRLHTANRNVTFSVQEVRMLL